MFRKQRQFNIISGQPNPALTYSRSHSYVQNHNKLHLTPIDKNIRRLDQSKDAKSFHYTYTQPNQINNSYSQADLNNNKSTLLNYVSTDYNIINHTPQTGNSQIASPRLFQQKLPLIKRKSPLTLHLKNTILFAPNYRQDYPERQARHEFHLRRRGLLQQICELQKKAGGRYFRTYK